MLLTNRYLSFAPALHLTSKPHAVMMRGRQNAQWFQFVHNTQRSAARSEGLQSQSFKMQHFHDNIHSQRLETRETNSILIPFACRFAPMSHNSTKYVLLGVNPFAAPLSGYSTSYHTHSASASCFRDATKASCLWIQAMCLQTLQPLIAMCHTLTYTGERNVINSSPLQRCCSQQSVWISAEFRLTPRNAPTMFSRNLRSEDWNVVDSILHSTYAFKASLLALKGNPCHCCKS